ncbi:serine-threonine protein kinase [Penicillium verhagenii]|nr:serine-threonine protein kinase [Penicillium verhagenii]
MDSLRPVSVGQVLNDRYEIIKKIGDGKYSIVWLARDQIHKSYSAIKVLREDCDGGMSGTFELDILKCLSEGNPNHRGYQHIPRLLDHFIHSRNLCLVLEPMAENLKDFCLFFEDARIPPFILKQITKQLLYVIEYAHALGIIHTVKVILGDWGTASWESRHLTEFIQPRLLRAPEVLLQAPWSKEVDIWNLGALLPELLDAVQMFSGRASVTGGHYLIKHHIEEMDALFGPFPSHLLEEGNQAIVRNSFNANLQIRDPTERPLAELGKWIKCLNGEEKERFLLLLRSMMMIDPKKRTPAHLLQNELWLTSQ